MNFIIILFLVSTSGFYEMNNLIPSDKITPELQTTTQNTLKRYDVKSGIVKYKISTSGKVMMSSIEGSGTESLYFKDWGSIELTEEESSQETTTKFFGKSKTETNDVHSMVKLINGEVFSVDFEKSVIFQGRNIAMELMQNDKSDPYQTGKDLLEAMGGKIIGSKDFLGYNCELWDIRGAEQLMYKGVLLKLDMTFLGVRTIKEAVSADFDIPVPEKHFKLPDFPVEKLEDIHSDEDYKEDIKNMKNTDDTNEKLKIMAKLSYEDWKKIILSDENDNYELQQMTEKQLRYTYDLMQKIAKEKTGN